MRRGSERVCESISTSGISVREVGDKMRIRMHGRVASLLTYNEKLKYLTGHSPWCTVQHHLVHRLFNVLVTQEEQRLEIRWQDMTLPKKQFPLDLTVKAFIPSGIKILPQDLITQKTAQPQKLKDITNEWIEVC